MALNTRWAVCSALGLALALPGAAQAAVKSVDMGTSKAQQKVINAAGSDVNAFFPSNVAVHVGDSVKFVPTNFHSVHFYGKSGKAAPAFVPTGKAVAGVTDAAGALFAFNGLPELGFNPALFTPPGKFGKTVVFNGKNEIQSALPLANKPKPMTVRFTKAGLFTYHCDLHPGMKATVRVAARSKPVPSAAADAKRVKTQFAKALAVAKGFSKVTPPANTVDLGLFGAGGANLFGFVPSKLTVPVGTTVTFRMTDGNNEVHTATTGPGDPEKDPKSYLGAIASSLTGPSPDPKGLFPSDPGPTPAALTPTLHGNGFWSSGVLDGLPGALPASSQVTFAGAGTYEFYCMIHPFMHGTITAQ
jgi:plastocyanin